MRNNNPKTPWITGNHRTLVNDLETTITALLERLNDEIPKAPDIDSLLHAVEALTGMLCAAKALSLADPIKEASDKC